MKIDLDAARAARREAADENPVVVLNGKEIALPVELPFSVAEQLSQIDPEALKADPASVAKGINTVLQSLLGKQYEKFMATQPSFNDLMVLIEGLVKVYGLDSLGESQASADS